MPSALRSGGGSVFSSTPGPALGDPLSATYARVPSGLAAMPRGRLPSGIVATVASVPASMTVRSPDVSFVTYNPTAGTFGASGAAGAGVDAAGGDSDGPQPAAVAATTANSGKTRRIGREVIMRMATLVS